MSRGYRYLEDVAIADAAFEAWGATEEELFLAASDATVNVMVADPETLRPAERRALRARAGALDLLLFALLQELVYYKDAEGLLLRVVRAEVAGDGGELTLSAEAWGEGIDPTRHELLADVKAVTLHRFRVWQEEKIWRATVILDT